jgi:hypothetical protein
MIEQQGILFATPKIPYRYTPQNKTQLGFFCVFTKEFLSKSKTGLLLDNFPIFQYNMILYINYRMSNMRKWRLYLRKWMQSYHRTMHLSMT